MPAMGMRILVIGKPSRGTNSILSRLASSGWGSRIVQTLREAEDLVKTFVFDIVLAAESLPDGRAYAMTEMMVRRRGTLLVAISLSESCLWLPVVEFGARVLGTRALNAEGLENEAQKILRARDKQQLRAVPSTAHRTPHRAGVPRRKTPVFA
jgi:DNA-binding response OmpR family regulator